MGIWSTRPDSAAIYGQVLATVTQWTRRSRSSSELNYHQRYLRIFRYLSLTALSPFWGRRACAENAGVATRQDAWQCVCYQVRRHIDRPDGKHAEYAGEIRHMPHRLGIRGGALRVSTLQLPARGWRLRNLAVTRCIGHHG